LLRSPAYRGREASYSAGVPSAPEPPSGRSCTTYDTERALAFLVEAFGFREALAVRDRQGDVVHAELRWPGGGAVVFGSTKHTEGVHGAMKPGTSASYVVADDVDAVYQRALAADAEIVQGPNETTFGSGVPTRAFTARDPEGNLWTFGTYRGARSRSR
jgi:uncharacterized glyoxalase superfamily protein PhnB